MSCDAPRSLLCNNKIISLLILSVTHVFLLWSSGHFCTTTQLNISLEPPPKLWDISSSMPSNFMQKHSDVLWKN